MFSQKFLRYLKEKRRQQSGSQAVTRGIRLESQTRPHGTITRDIIRLAQSDMCRTEIIKTLGCSRQMVSLTCKRHQIVLPKKPTTGNVRLERPDVAIKRWLRMAGWKYCPKCFGIYCRTAKGREAGYCSECSKAKTDDYHRRQLEYHRRCLEKENVGT